MAISSTNTSSTTTTTSSLDVASIVSQLMTAENKPLDTIKNKISTQQVFISDMGTIKSDVAALQDALGVFEDMNSYGNLSAISTDSSVVTATASAGASAGTHRVVVSQGAQISAYNITGFSSNSDLINLDQSAGFQITVGGTTYSTSGTKIVNGAATANAISLIGKTGKNLNNQAASTVTDLQNWINSLGINISASLAQQNGSQWTLRVAGSGQGANQDFSLSGLLGGKAYGGFRTNNSSISLDPATGFQITINGQVHSTLGVLPNTTTISALASWINGLNADVNAAVTGSAGSYSLQIQPSNGAIVSSAGLPGAYANGFGGPNELVNLDGTSGFQVSVGGVTYQTAGPGAIQITGTGPGNAITVTDLANWINHLSGANLSATVLGSGTDYSLEVSNTNPLTSPAIALSGFVSGSGQDITTLDGFASATSIVSLDSPHGFELTVGGNTYRTGDSGTLFNGHTLPSFNHQGLGSTSTLSDVRDWIDDVSTLYGLGLTASINQAGSSYSLSISGSSVASVAGINPNTVISGFNNATEAVNLAPGGVVLTVGSNAYHSTGTLGPDATLTSLNDWINSVASGDVTSSIIGSNGAYSLLVSANNNTDTVSLTGVTSASNLIAIAVKGFSASSDPVSIDQVNGLSLTYGNATYTTQDLSPTLLTSYGGDLSLPSLSDIAQWINDLASNHSLNLTASIGVAGDGSTQLMVSQTNGSTQSISIAGINSSAYQAGFTTDNPMITLDSGTGFEFNLEGTSHSTKNYGGSITTLGDLKDWINTIQNANAQIIHNGLDYRLLINSTDNSNVTISSGIINSITITNSGSNPLQSSIVASADATAQSGTNTISITQTAKARTFIYSSSTNLVTLDPTDGFKISIGGNNYSTNGGVVNGINIPTLQNANNSPTVDDLAAWINVLDNTYTLGIAATVTNDGVNNVLNVTGSLGTNHEYSVSGLYAPTTDISGFSSVDSPIAFNNKFTISMNGESHDLLPNGITGSGPGNAITLTDLRDWINSLSWSSQTNIDNHSRIQAGIEGSGFAYELKLLQIGNPSTIFVSGLTPDVVDMGFPTTNATLNLDSNTGFTISVNNNSYDTKVIPIVSHGVDSAVTAADLVTWINALKDGSTQIFNAQLVGDTQNGYALKVTNFTTGSTDGITLSGVINATSSSNANNNVNSGQQVLTASASANANTGIHAVNIKQNAAATVFNIGGFADSSALVDVNNLNIIVGSNVYYTDGITLTGATIGYDGALINTVSGGTIGTNVNNLIALSANHDGTVTINDLANWINGLGDHIQAQVQTINNGHSAQLHVNGTITGVDNAVALTHLGNVKMRSQNDLASATVSGFSSSDLVALDPSNGFEITIQKASGAITYSTKSGVSRTTYIALNGSLTGDNTSNIAKLGDLINWINAIPDGSVTANTDASNQLIINAKNSFIESIAATGLKSTVSLTGNPLFNIDPVNGIVIDASGSTYRSNDVNPPLSGTVNLQSIKNWINGLGSSLQASFVQDGSVNALVIYENPPTGSGAITISGIGSNNFTITGFKNYGDKVDNSFKFTIGGINYDASKETRINTQTTVNRMTKSGVDASGQSYSTLGDLNNWINALKGAGVGITSSISGSPNQYNNNFSDIHVQGDGLVLDPANDINPPWQIPSNPSFNGVSDSYYSLYAGGVPQAYDQHATPDNTIANTTIGSITNIELNNATYGPASGNPSPDGFYTLISYVDGSFTLNVSDSFGFPINSLTLNIAYSADGGTDQELANANQTILDPRLIDGSNGVLTLGAEGLKIQFQFTQPVASMSARDLAAYIANATSYATLNYFNPDGSPNTSDPTIYVPTGQSIVTPLHVGDVTELSYSNVPTFDLTNRNDYQGKVDHFLVRSNGPDVTLFAYQGKQSDSDPDVVLGSQTLTIGNVEQDSTISLTFNQFHNAGGNPVDVGGVKITLHALINSVDYLNAADLIAQSLMFANRQPGTFGWLTNNADGLGLALTIQGTKPTINPISIDSYNAYDEISGADLHPSLSPQWSGDNLASNGPTQFTVSAKTSTGFTSVSQNGGVTVQGNSGARAFILKGTDSNYVLVDDPRNIIYDGTARFWQGPYSDVDPNYRDDISRGQILPNGQWIGQPGVVLNTASGNFIYDTNAYTGILQSDGTVFLNYDYNSPVNNVTIARDAKGTLDGDFFRSSSNDIYNVANSGINLHLIQTISPYDLAADANVTIQVPSTYSNTPVVATPPAASISQAATQDTVALINNQSHTWNNLGPITVNGITYSFTGNVDNGNIEATVQVVNPTSIDENVAIDTTLTTDALTSDNNAVSISSYAGGNSITSVAANSVSNYILDGGITKYSTAQDARLTIDGIELTRSTNTISDFVPGVTFQIMANPLPGTSISADIQIELGADNTEKLIGDLMNAYNKLIKDYNAMTGNANNGRLNNGKAGTFGNAPTTLAFVETIKRKFATGASYNIGRLDSNSRPYVLSLVALGLDYQLDGTLKYNSVEYLTSQANGLRQKFLQGLRIGYVSPTDNLMTFIKAQSGANGALAQEMIIEQTSINALSKEQDNLQTRLNKIQDSYIAQYSGLNALLFQLNSTSTNLGSALSALTNMAAGK